MDNYGLNKEGSSDKKSNLPFLVTVLVVVVVAGAAMGAIEIYSLKIEMERLRTSYGSRVMDLGSEIFSLNREREELMDVNKDLRRDLKEEQRTVGSLLDRLEEMTGEVEEIRKLQEIDPELLKKYSKVYFLNENYEPSGLEEIPDKYLAVTRDEAYFHEKAWPFLQRMLRSADRRGFEPRVVSGFRSFEEQSELKQKYNVIYGEGTANQFSASQGYSEHQLGTAVDLSVEEMEGALGGFDNTEFYEWLKDNAHRHGFVLSYPENNPSYQFEPWHWRFVGVDLAKELHERDMYFYDMEQRKIDDYRIKLFDR
ncbi:MAG: D-alanyl-D-alanine carboxypeptidase family protein [Patescibacteria group bacterium]